MKNIICFIYAIIWSLSLASVDYLKKLESDRL